MITNYIQKIESTYLDKVNLFLDELFEQTFLPSHDRYHHQRVWKNAVHIITELESLSYSFTYEYTEALFIACMFHDSGLVEELGEEHGEAGMELCNSFFEDISPKPAMLQEALDAIEFHDDKDYKSSKRNPKELISILSAADDIDAFGYIGIYRYAEIYLLRGIPVENLGNRVLQNLENRYKQIQQQYGSIENLIRTLQSKYDIVQHFYHNLNNHFINHTSSVKSHEFEIIDDIYKHIIKSRKQPQVSTKELLASETNTFKQNFYHNFLQEYESGN